MTIAALILAAGQSRRMGQDNKLLMDWPHQSGPADGPADGTVIGAVADTVLASVARPVLVVTGHQHMQVQAALQGRALGFVHCAAHEAGLAESLKAGIAALPGSVRGVLVCLGDMPLVRPGLLNTLAGAHASQSIVVPCFGGRRGNPVLWDRYYFAEMGLLQGDRGARFLMDRYPSHIVPVNAPDDSVLRDIDTPADWAALHGTERGDRDG